MKILIAEDDFTSRAVLAGILKKCGYAVIETIHGAAAWEALQQPDAPELLILDRKMPEINGMELLHRIRRLETKQPPYVIMLTSMDERLDVVAGLNAGANDYLTKPYDARELVARVEVGRRMIEMQIALAAKVEELQQAIEHIKTLRGILPICSHCKNIKNDKGYWDRVEVYIHDHTDAEFSHSLCPTCLKELFPDMYEKILEGEPLEGTKKPASHGRASGFST